MRKLKRKTCIAQNEKKGRFGAVMVSLAALSALLILISISVGYYGIPVGDIPSVLFSGESTSEYTVLMKIRLPRILAAFAIGAALSASGSAYQGMFKNPVVSSDILGVSSGAGLGASIAITLGLSYFAVQSAAFIFGLAAVLVTYLISARVRFSHTVSLILGGTMLGALCNAAITMLKYVADPNDTLPGITFWLMGSLAKVDMTGFMFSIVPMAAGGALLFAMRYRLNLLTLGDDEAQSLGVNPRRMRMLAIVGATLMSSAAVCLGGLIGFVGLMIPHIARGLVGPQYGRLLPAAMLAGGCYLLIMDDIARSAASMEIPLGVLTAFVGAPFFIYLIRRKGDEF